MLAENHQKPNENWFSHPVKVAEITTSSSPESNERKMEIEANP
jgi:hypothetical protein